MATRKETTEHIQVFNLWYSLDRNSPKTAEVRRIKERTLRDWVALYNWHERADRLDQEVLRNTERQAVERKTQLIEDQRRIGQLLRNTGAAFLEQKGDQSAANMRDAVAAISKGFELERQAEGLPDWVGTILNASDDELRDGYQQLLRRSQAEGRLRGRSETTGD